MVVVYLLPAVYQAETLILVESQRIPEKYVAATVNADLQDRLSTISQQILSYTRLLEIIEKFGLYAQERKSAVQEEIIEMMRGDIKIKLEKGWSKERPGAFRVAYQGSNPTVVAEVANRLGNFFIDENLRAREVQAVGTSEFMDSQLQQAKKTLEEQEVKLSKYKLQYNGELPQQENTLIATLGRLQVQLQGVQDAMNRAQQNKLMLENSLSTAQVTATALDQMAVQIAAQAAAAQSPMGGAVPPKKKSEQLKGELESLRFRYSPEHPEVKRLQNEIARLQNLEQKEPPEAPAPPVQAPAEPLSASPESIKPGKLAAAPQMAQTLIRERERVESLRTELALVARQMEALGADRKRVLQEVAAAQSRLEKLPIREQQLAAVTRDYEISRTNYKSLLDKKLAADLASDMERRQKAERFTVLDVARVPERPIKPDRPLLSGLGCALGLVLGTVIAAARELKKGVLLGEWELPSAIQILGRVPRMGPTTAGFERSKRKHGGGSRPQWRKWRVAVVSSALLSLLGAIAVGVYFLRSRF